MKILFAGTPDIAVPTLQALAGRFEVVGVLTGTDKPQGRRKVPVPPPVKTAALALGLPVVQFDHLGREAREAVRPLGADTLVCFAYGKMFGPKFLALFRTALNIHPSLLPELRGPSPIQGAILEGLSRTGITIQTLAAEMDAGDVAGRMTLPLDGTETGLSLTERVAQAAPDLAVRTLSAPLTFTPQEGKATYTRLLSREDGPVDWNRSAAEVSRRIRALYPWPKASTTLSGATVYLCGAGAVDGKAEGAPGTVLAKDKHRGLLVACGEGGLWITRLQKQAKNEMDASAFANGIPSLVGSVFGA